MTPSRPGFKTPLSRRRVLALGGGLAAGGLFSATAPPSATAAATHAVTSQSGHLPVAKMEEILAAQGTVSKGVLQIEISRDDIGDVSGPLGVTFTPAFEISGTLTFQPLGDDNAFFNGDLPLRAE